MHEVETRARVSGRVDRDRGGNGIVDDATGDEDALGDDDTIGDDNTLADDDMTGSEDTDDDGLSE